MFQTNQSLKSLQKNHHNTFGDESGRSYHFKENMMSETDQHRFTRTKPENKILLQDSQEKQQTEFICVNLKSEPNQD